MKKKKCPSLPHFKKKKDVPHELNSPMTDDEPNDNALLFLHLPPLLTWCGNQKVRKIILQGRRFTGSTRSCKLTLRHPCSTDWVSSFPAAEGSVDANDHEVFPFPCGFGHWGTIEHGLLWRLCRCKLHFEVWYCFVQCPDWSQKRIY